ncbi:tetratricopeptide repeat protein [Rossellomorea aquimaris]|uniref:tetratricopeptide repeat protein n=1 Tax=Rossellomorea aquimaris TaxID=189382 RepID=UPI001CD6F54F|nr:tetratricopeptide repeat protein [Rossellomorea aquimaris]MCA1056354.1 tetratricopeptide repeat protein [Rossellomorea aquimaris]
MTKKNNEGKGKVLQFPGLKERLLEKGVQALESGDIQESADLLTQAYEMEPDNPDINTALVLALYENKKYDEAKVICKEMLLEGIGDYFEVVDMYLMILIQLHQHQEVIDTLHALFDEKEVPFEKEEHFKKLLQFSEKVRDGKEPDSEVKEDTEIPVTTILKDKSLEEQTLITAQLVNQNIRPYLHELLSYLGKGDSHPFLQSMILNVLREHGYDKEVSINKLNEEVKVIPSSLQDVFESDTFKRVSEELEELLSQRNPTLYQHAHELVKRHCFLLYPLELQGKPEDLAVVYGSYSAEMFADSILWEELNGEIEKSAECHSLMEQLRELEEISSPII